MHNASRPTRDPVLRQKVPPCGCPGAPGNRRSNSRHYALMIAVTPIAAISPSAAVTAPTAVAAIIAAPAIAVAPARPRTALEAAPFVAAI